MGVHWGVGCNLWYIAWEDVFWAIEIVAELEVVNFGGSAQIAVLADDEIENVLGWGHQSEAFKYAEELL